METLLNDGDAKKELDDSGVQDVGKQTELRDRPAELLDLSDDVLLCILKFCSPRDLKALGFSCPRLGRLVRDRTLWTRVDARGQRTGRARMRWLLAHALGINTVELKLQGYALAARGCLGHVNRKRREVEEDRALREQQQQQQQQQQQEETEPAASSSDGNQERPRNEPVPLLQEADPLATLQRLYAQNRCPGAPDWPEEGPAEVDPEDVVLLDGSCPGPQFTLTQCMLRQLRLHCSLTSLALEYCNINCNTTGINHFPPTLKKLSLKGAKCYNLPLDKSFLFNIQDYLPAIEYLDLSECEWLEPASLLPLSKVSNLKHLIMRDCYRLSEFVAYASLATRYGFRKLEILDVRGSPVADSEVSALGWLPALLELYASPAPPAPAALPRDHSHYRDEPLPPHQELDPWETEEPEHFKIPLPRFSPEDAPLPRDYERDLCLHGLEYNLCVEGAWYRRKTQRKRPSESSDQEKSSDEAPSPAGIGPTTVRAKKVIEVSLRGREGYRTTHSVRILPSHQRYNLRDQFDEAGLPKKMKLSTDEGNSSTADKSNVDEENSSTADKSNVDEETSSTVDKADDVDNQTEAAPQMEVAEEKPGCSKDGPKKPDGGPPKKRKTDDKIDKALSRNPLRKRFSFDARPGCSKDVGTNTPFFDGAGPSKRKKTDKKSDKKPDKKPVADDVKPGCSKDNNETPANDKSDTSDDDMPLKLLQNDVNEGASTSKESDADEPDQSDDCHKPDEHLQGCKCKQSQKYEYVRFRQNMDPVIVRRDPAEVEREERERQNENENREVRPRAHVLYVNVGQQLHTVYRLSIHNEPPIFYSFAGNSHLRFRPNVGNIFYTPPAPHLDSTALVSDSAIRRFGRADFEDVHVVHIGPRIGAGEPGSRPNRSSLRVLSVTGFRNITDRSLVHLATAAPDLRLIDFTGTRVTAQGVENFKSLRPECEVRFCPFVEPDDAG